MQAKNCDKSEWKIRTYPYFHNETTLPADRLRVIQLGAIFLTPVACSNGRDKSCQDRINEGPGRGS